MATKKAVLKVIPVVANGHQVGSSLVCVRTIRPGVNEPMNAAQKISAPLRVIVPEIEEGADGASARPLGKKDRITFPKC